MTCMMTIINNISVWLKFNIFLHTFDYFLLTIRYLIIFQLFDRLRSEKSDFMQSIRIIDGHLDDSSMGLSSSDREWMVENVNFVFHCAATIKFNEPLELASKINIQGTEHVLELASQMKNLKVITIIIQ